MRRRSKSSSAGARSQGGPSAASWLTLLILCAAAAIIWWMVWQQRTPAPATVPTPQAGTLPAPPPPPKSAFREVRFPTDQDILKDPSTPGVFQPTAAGNPESALYGSVRSTQIGGRLMPSFHEGIDIAPLQRDRRGRPLDAVHAVADGRVGHVNRAPGNSNYGNYVVLLHEDPLGEVYTLYAHLAEIADGIRPGVAIPRGTVLGRMGNTPTTIVPMARAHTHFEIGLVNNTHFERWFRAQRLKPDHGNYNGWNLMAVDPRGCLRMQRDSREFEFRSYLVSLPVAFEVVIAARGPLDYFRRYPSLWQGAPFAGGWMVLRCADNGVPLSGRVATPDEVRQAGERRAAVLKADAAVLGRNGTRLVVHDNGAWRIGRSGERWLEILTYP